MCLRSIVGGTCRTNSSQHIHVAVLEFSCSTQQETLNTQESRWCRRVSNCVPPELKSEGCLTFGRCLCDRWWRGRERGRGRSSHLTAVGISHGVALYVLLRTELRHDLVCRVTGSAMVRLYVSCYRLSHSTALSVLLPTEPWRGFVCPVTDCAMAWLHLSCHWLCHGTALSVLLPTEPWHVFISLVTDLATARLYLSCYRLSHGTSLSVLLPT